MPLVRFCARLFTIRAGQVILPTTALNKQILGILSAGFPSYGYRGEELGLVRHSADPAGHLWLVDPDDGTAAFDKGFRGAAVSIALLHDGRPVLGVVYAYSAPDDGGDLFTWAEGTGRPKRNGKCVPQPGDEAVTVERIVLLSHHADQNSSCRFCAFRGAEAGI